jgi:hypothetical protein
MRISLDSAGEHYGALAPLDGVEARSLTGDEASEWIRRAARARHSLDGVIAALSARVDELSSLDAGRDRYARARGFASPQQLIASDGDFSSGDAHKFVELGRMMVAAEDAPALMSDSGEAEPALFAYLSGVVSRGELGAEKATVIRGVLEEMSNATVEIERSLVDRARRKSLRDVKEMCTRELARADRDALRAREVRNRQKRFVSFKEVGGGLVSMSGLLDHETVGPLRAYIEPEVQRQLNLQRDMITQGELGETERRDVGQMYADVFADMARHMSGCVEPADGIKTALVVRVTLDALERGVGLAECDTISGPITIECLRAMAVDVGVLPMVMGGASLPLDLGRVKRLYTLHQRIALGERDGGCAMCGAALARCHAHHIQFWSNDGRTDLRNGVLLCGGCHHRLHDYGWRVEVDEHDDLWFVPPATVDPQRRRQPACSARSAA